MSNKELNTKRLQQYLLATAGIAEKIYVKAVNSPVNTKFNTEDHEEEFQRIATESFNKAQFFLGVIYEITGQIMTRAVSTEGPFGAEAAVAKDPQE